jgi:hypothetical protein
MFLECGYSQVSGVAVGGSNILINVGGCGHYFEYTKTGTKVGAHPIQPSPAGDIECDNLSYTVSVFWARDGWGGPIRAYEQPAPHACVFGGGLALP